MGRRKTSQPDYDAVFASGSSRRRTRRLDLPVSSGTGDMDPVQFVEDQLRAITAALKLQYPLPLEPEPREPEKLDPDTCEQCLSGAPAHLHGAKLFEHGKEMF